MLTTRGGTRVIGDLTEMGYDCRWTVMGAADVGANHKRDRFWLVAKWRGHFPHAQHDRIGWWKQQQESTQKSPVGQPKCSRLEGQRSQSGEQEVSESWNSGSLADTEDKGDVWRQWIMGFAEQEHDQGRGQTNWRRKWWQAEPDVGRVAHGVAARVDRLKAIGNGQVPLCAATAWRVLNEGWS